LTDQAGHELLKFHIQSKHPALISRWEQIAARSPEILDIPILKPTLNLLHSSMDNSKQAVSKRKWSPPRTNSQSDQDGPTKGKSWNNIFRPRKGNTNNDQVLNGKKEFNTPSSPWFQEGLEMDNTTDPYYCPFCSQSFTRYLHFRATSIRIHCLAAHPAEMYQQSRPIKPAIHVKSLQPQKLYQDSNPLQKQTPTFLTPCPTRRTSPINKWPLRKLAPLLNTPMPPQHAPRPSEGVQKQETTPMIFGAPFPFTTQVPFSPRRILLLKPYPPDTFDHFSNN
jgi:hypothetical protein